MQKILIAIIFFVFSVLFTACGPAGEIRLEAAAQQAIEVTTSIPTDTALAQKPTSTPTNIPPTKSTRPSEPAIPAIVEEFYQGVPAGNGYRPQRVAIDSQQRRLYTFNEGLGSIQAGNSISVIDLDTGQVTGLLKLNNMQAEDLSPPNALDLQLDPYRPRLYALWGDPYADTPATNLTIIDTDQLTILDTLPGVEAIAPGPNRLYLAHDTRLWVVNPDSLAELGWRTLEPRRFNVPVRLNVEANRLYLGRGRPWSLEIFAADSLAPVGSYPTTGDLLHALIDETNQHLLVIEKEDSQAMLHTLDYDGQPLSNLPPTPLADNVYSSLPLAFTDQSLYLVEPDPASYDTYRLRTMTWPDLTVLASLSLFPVPNNLAIDPATGRLYAPYSSTGSYVLAIDPAGETIEMIHTALDILDALADPAANRLYVLNDHGTLQVLNLTSYEEMSRMETGLDMSNSRNRYLAQLSLDPGRKRLYLSGDPVRTIDTASFRVTAYPGTRGQLTPDPGRDRLYLTPPCRCREEQCNTFILSADTLTGTETLFPPEDPLTAPCVTATTLDHDNELLYATIYNGIPGSNSGDYFAVFDTGAATPQQIYTDSQISYGDIVLDPLRQRAFAPRYRMDRSFIYRFEAQGQTISPSLELVGAQGQLAYDPQNDRLYAVDNTVLQVYDGDLALLAEISLPGEFELLTFDRQNQRLYLASSGGRLLVVASSGGQLDPPPPAKTITDYVQPQHLFVAPDGTRFLIDDWRLYRARGDGQPWQLLGKGLPGRLVNDLAISPHYEQDRTLLAGLWHFGRGGGLYRSTDGGDTWLPTTRGLTDLEIQQVVFSPTFARDRTVFLTTLDHGLFRSTDGGESWVSLAAGYATDSYDQKVSHLALSPTFARDGLIFIGHYGLLRSTDGGETWQSTGQPAGRVAFSPYFARGGLILNEGRWRSTDGGDTWEPTAVGLEQSQYGAQRIFFSPKFTADQTVYILLRVGGDAPLSLQRSVDAGRSWQSLLGGLPPDFRLAAAALLPTGELSLRSLAGQEVTVAPDRLKWGRPTVDMAALELQDLAVAPDGPIFVANSAAGVFKSTDQGRTWIEVDFPARTNETQPARLALAEDGTLFAAVGPVIERSFDGGQTWTYLSDLPTGLTVTALAVSPNFAADDLVLAGGDYRQNQLLRSTDGGDTWQVVFDGATVEGASDVSLIAFSPHFATDGQVYAWLREGGLLHSIDGGRRWSLVTSEQSGYFAQSLVISPDDRLYLGALGGHLLVSTDDGQTWLDRGENIADERVWSSSLVQTADGILFLGTDVGVYRSRDGGQTWTSASAGLPLNPVEDTPQSIQVLRLSSERLYAALAEGGLFISDDGGQSWSNALTGRRGVAMQATPTPAPRPTDLPTPTPQFPASPADCPNTPAYLADLWTGRVAQLGCPLAGQKVMMAEQTFQGGHMFWRSDLAAIYVIPSIQPYARFDDTWDDSQPAYTCPDISPPQTPPTPQRGFGKVWCSQPKVRQLLGNVTSQEHLFEATLQEFETGLMFQTDQGVTYVLESRLNGWERVE